MGNGLSGTRRRMQLRSDSVQRFDADEADDDEVEIGTKQRNELTSTVRRMRSGGEEHFNGGVVPGTIGTVDSPGNASHVSQQSANSEMESATELDPNADDGYFDAQERLLYENDLASMPTKHNAPTQWKRGDIIGSGAFGSVHVALNVDTGELIAVKSVPVFPSSDEEHAKRMSDLQTEIGLMGKLNHPNIVCYLGASSDKQNFNILMEFVPGGSIASMLKNFGHFEEVVVSRYTHQILDGLLYLHSYRIDHRDIKGANILIDSTGVIKLADFGASKQVADLVYRGNGHVSLRGTPFWMAPEVRTVIHAQCDLQQAVVI